jgi:hypothetical protein
MRRRRRKLTRDERGDGQKKCLPLSVSEELA